MKKDELIHHPSCSSVQTGWHHTGDCVSGCGPYPSLPPSGYPKRKEQVVEKVETAHVPIIECKNSTVRYIKCRWVGSNEVLSDSVKPKAEMVFDDMSVRLEPVEFDVTDRAALDAEACVLLDLEAHQLLVELPDPYGSMKNAVSWAVNYELGTAALVVFYPDTVGEARKVKS